MADVVMGYNESDLAGIESGSVVYPSMSPGVWHQHAITEIEREFLKNETQMLIALGDTEWVPRVLEYDDETLETEFVKNSAITDEKKFRRSMVNFLLWMSERDLRHGDLTAKNILVRDNTPVIVDWKQARWQFEQHLPAKRYGTDAKWAWEAALELSPDTSRHIRRWLAIRDHIGTEKGNILVDLCCDRGDFVAMALTEEIPSYGVDINPVAIGVANQIWNANFFEQDVFDFTLTDNYNDYLVFSCFPYWVEQRGLAEATGLLFEISHRADTMFFETQLYGDGPGLEFMKTDEDVFNFLRNEIGGKIDRLAQIPVHGRDTARSVWMVR